MAEDAELVSIVVPFHNAERYIDRCLKCLAEQSYQNIEAIFVDDGSDDRSVEILQNCNDARMKLVSIKKSGVSTARNIGIQKASGTYITFWDVDDIPHSDFVATFVEDILKYKVDTVICNYDDVFAGEKHTKVYLPWKNEIIQQKEIEDVLLPRMIYPWNRENETEIRGIVWRTFTHTELVRRNQIYFDADVAMAEDFLFTLELYRKSKSIYVEEKSLYDYIRSSTSTMNTYVKDNLERNVVYHEKLVAQLKRLDLYEKNQGRYEANRLSMYSTSISNCVRNGVVHEGVLENLRRMHEMLKNDKIEIAHSKAPLKIRVTGYLLQMKLYGLLIAIYVLKEKIRIARYN